MRKLDFDNIFKVELPRIFDKAKNKVGRTIDNTKIKIKDIKEQIDASTQKKVIYFSLIAIMFAILGCLSIFVGYDEYDDAFFRFPNLKNFVYILMTLTPGALWLIYLLNFFEKLKHSVLVAIVFSIFTIGGLYTISDFSFAFAPVFRLLFNVSAIVIAVFAIKSALKGLWNKTPIKVAMIFRILLEVLFLIIYCEDFSYFVRSRWLYLFSFLFGSLGNIGLSLALLLFSLKTKIPVVITERKKISAQNSSIDTAEYNLKDLQNKLDFGMISEQEYEEARKEIIRNL